MQMVDPVSKLVILTSPKGGATVTAHLVFEYLSLTEKALATSPWIHTYRTTMYDKDPFYKKQNPCEVCKEGSEWTCLFIIRSPADRVVSSFIHVLRTILAPRLPGYEDVFHKDPSFRDYIDVLMQFRRNETLQFDDRHHAGPQDITHHCNDDESLDIKYVAVEFLDDGLRAFSNATGNRFGSNTSASSFTSPHYVEQYAAANETLFTKDITQTPFSLLKSRQGAYPSYDSFFGHVDLNRDIFCCLFDDDLAMYQRTCTQSWLVQRCPTCEARCWREVARLNALKAC